MCVEGKQLNAWHLSSSNNNNKSNSNDGDAVPLEWHLVEGAETSMTAECNLCVKQSLCSIYLPPSVATDCKYSYVFAQSVKDS